MNEIITFGTVQNGRLTLGAKELLAKQLKVFPDAKVQVIIRKQRSRRSDRLNRYYWGGVLPPIAQYTGHTTEELHELFKMKFLLEKIVHVKWQKDSADKFTLVDVPIYKSTTNLDSFQFMDYLDRVIAEAATMGIRIYSPEEYYQGEV